MCSSPKGSTKYRRHTRKKEFSRIEYEEYARMVRRASACYEAAQQRKSEKRQQTASQQSGSSNKPIGKQQKAVNKDDKISFGVLSGIKAFLMKPVF